MMNTQHTSGQRTKFHKDVKIEVRAGIPTNKQGDYKIRKVGYDVFRHYFDTKEMDCQVGSTKLKRVLNY